MTKRIFLAGASGAIGRRLAPLLVANGWLVFGSTRSKGKETTLRSMGVEPVLVDVFDGAALSRLVSEFRPEIVIHQLTDLPYALEAGEMTAALVRNARLRDEGTKNLVSAAVNAGAKRLIAQSISIHLCRGIRPEDGGRSSSAGHTSRLRRNRAGRLGSDDSFERTRRQPRRSFLLTAEFDIVGQLTEAR